MHEALPKISTAESNNICPNCQQNVDIPNSACSHKTGELVVREEDPLVGTVFADRYEILRLIGDGGMGKVYKARHQLMKRHVAIKVLHPELVADHSTLKRFQREAESASRLNHPNVVTVHDFGLTPTAFLVMDYLEGVSLEDLLETSNHLDFERSLRIFVQICSGLAHAHQNSIIHRDLKPSNIMLVNTDAQQELVKIVDFGIAKVILQNEVDNELTAKGEVIGSPYYMSPEQCHGTGMDTFSDIYSLGCVMYRTLTGFQPVGGLNIMQCMYNHVYSTPEIFKNICSELDLPEAAEAIIYKAMAKEQQARFKSMLELKEALEALQQKSPSKVEDITSPPQEDSLAQLSPISLQGGANSGIPPTTCNEIVQPNLKASGSAPSRSAIAAEAGRAASAVEAGWVAYAAEAGRAAFAVESGLVASATEAGRAAAATEAGLAELAKEAVRVAAATETKHVAAAVEAGFAAEANEAELAASAAEAAYTASVAEAKRAALAAESRRAAAACEAKRVLAAAEAGRSIAAAEIERAAAAAEAGRAIAAVEADRATAAAESGRAAYAAETSRAAGAAEIGRATFAAEVGRVISVTEAERASADQDDE